MKNEETLRNKWSKIYSPNLENAISNMTKLMHLSKKINIIKSLGTSYIPNHPQQIGSQELDFEGLSLSSKHRHQDTQVQSSIVLEAPLMQLNNWAKRRISLPKLCKPGIWWNFKQKQKCITRPDGLYIVCVH